MNKKIIISVSTISVLIILLIITRFFFSNQNTSIEPANSTYQTKLDCGIAKVNDNDGNIYSTVTVGTQCWMGENMNTGVMMPSGKFQSDNNIVEKYCYNNEEHNCLNDGGLYSLGEATQYNFSTEGIKGICPTGWHIPTDKEWYILEDYLKNPGETCDKKRVMFMKNKEKKNDTEFDCLGAGTQMKLGGNSGLNIPLAGIAIENNANLSCQGICPPSTKMEFMSRLRSASLCSSSQSGSRILWNDGSVVDKMVGRETGRSGVGSVRCIKD
jgi:uncharacterized protein (TIGR02145 family)